MIPLKEDGSIDAKQIVRLPIEEYIEVVENMTQEQYREYASATMQLINETREQLHLIEFDGTIEEDMERIGAVGFDDFINKVMEEDKKNDGSI